MKRIIGLSLLLVSIAAGCKRETNVVEYPAVDFYTTETLDVNRIELTDSTTVLHFSAVYIPKFWIRLDKGTHIVADGLKIPCIGIDETSLQDDLFTFLTNKDGHCRQGSLIAAVRGTKAEDVLTILLQIPEKGRLRVKEVTADLSDTMAVIVHTAFPNAILTLDCFHIMKRCIDGVEEIRLRYGREAQAEQLRLELEHRRRLKRYAARRRCYRKKHPKNYKGKTRGRKPLRKNERFRPPALSNGDTRNELLKRSRYALTQTPDKWSERQNAQMNTLFQLYPKLKEAYDITNRLKAIFRSPTLDRETAKVKFREWYKDVSKCSLREMKAARDAVRSREDEILNYFIDHSTNAGAESFNSKIKGFRAQLRGVSDLPFIMFRLCTIFG